MSYNPYNQGPTAESGYGHGHGYGQPVSVSPDAPEAQGPVQPPQFEIGS
jgi:hypothetical protein